MVRSPITSCSWYSTNKLEHTSEANVATSIRRIRVRSRTRTTTAFRRHTSASQTLLRTTPVDHLWPSNVADIIIRRNTFRGRRRMAVWRRVLIQRCFRPRALAKLES
nr:hypothetical protein Itr_chr09CG19880 [Ipomoea trifida]